MSEYLIFTMVPALCMVVWALFAKLHRKDWANSLFILVSGFTVLVNGIIDYRLILEGNVPLWMLLTQVVLAPTIVPQAYAYFCRMMGTKGSLGVNVSLWVVMVMLFLPSLSIDLHPSMEVHTQEPIKFMYVNIFDAGHRIYAFSIPSLVILIQAILTSVRIPVVVKQMRQYELSFSAAGKSFIAWWMGAILFIVFSSLISMEMLRQPVYSWVFFVVYSLLITIIFGHIASGLDLHPVKTSEDEEVDMDAFIRENQELAHRARRLFVEEKLYLHPGIVIDDVVSMLGTNRTYFTRMMRAEFGMSFNEYITSERIEYSQSLLLRTEKTLEEVAEESGFSNASAYCRVFKRITNTSPDAWRKLNKK